MLMHCFAVNALFLRLSPKPDSVISHGKTTQENQIRFQLSFCSICGRPRICARILQWASYLALWNLTILPQCGVNVQVNLLPKLLHGIQESFGVSDRFNSINYWQFKLAILSL